MLTLVKLFLMGVMTSVAIFLLLFALTTLLPSP